MYKSSDEGYQVRGVFLDMSKAFDKVRHNDLLFKLKQGGISGNLLSFPTDKNSFFSVLKNANSSAKDLNNNSDKISDWAFQQKINFNPNPSKQAQKVIFSRKTQNQNPRPGSWNKVSKITSLLQKFQNGFWPTFLLLIISNHSYGLS